MNLDDLVGAIRAPDGGGDGGGDDPDLAAATRLRVMRSLEVRARSRHQLIGFATAVAILLGGTVSWALATGVATRIWAPVPRPDVSAAPAPTPAPAPVPTRRKPARPAIAIAPTPALPPETVAPPAPVETPPPAPVEMPGPVRPAPAAALVAQPVEVLYRRAHDLHFHGGDPAATLAAWDAYLAAEPGGRFSVDARYNRAIILIRMRRYTDARAALLPFARGEVEPAGYRRTEAEQLVERLARNE